MKKIIAILISIPLVFLSACGESSKPSDVAESTTQIVESQAAVSTSETVAAVDDVVFYEETLDEIHYSVSDLWRKVDYSNDSLKQCAYYLDETNENCVMTMLLYADNTIYTRQQAEDYMDIFMNGFFSLQNGYSDGSFSSYVASVPARHGNYVNSGAEVEVYCYLPSTTTVFILSKWHMSGSSSEIDDDTFLKVVNSIQMPELNVTDESSTPSGNTYSPGFTNKYGTADTKCAYSGCNSKIATTGDTNCCIDHSNNCLNCGCYIDSDAMYCMSCLSGSTSGSKKNYDYDKGYGYSAPKEGQSFSDYVKEQDPDLYNAITDNYNSAVGNNSTSSNNYDYDKGYGYSAPKQGQSFSDYVKEQDPDLYASLFS